MRVILYTTGCPVCKMLKAKLDQACIQYEVESDTEKMLALGFRSAPMLQVNEQMLTSAEAMKWIEGEMKK
ncbi:MAG: hypothetical protein IKN04_03410 [Clostridia bacterium]|nr:hypothetical protein [Clostridia bacterium]